MKKNMVERISDIIDSPEYHDKLTDGHRRLLHECRVLRTTLERKGPEATEGAHTALFNRYGHLNNKQIRRIMLGDEGRVEYDRMIFIVEELVILAEKEEDYNRVYDEGMKVAGTIAAHVINAALQFTRRR